MRKKKPITLTPKQQLKRSRLPLTMKTLIEPMLNKSSKMIKGKVFGLTKQRSMGTLSPKIKHLGFGADKNGFFIYTHRARSKSRKNLKFTVKEITFIQSTA